VRILILGGGTFVGRALVESAVERGHEVTTLTHSSLPPGALEGKIEALHGDRTASDGLQYLANREWDVVFDTWAGAPRVVAASVNALRDRVPYYSYVSSRSVYREPMPAGSDETHPTVDGHATADATDYAADKRGAELAVIDRYGEDRRLLARAGLILGPHEGPGRLPWWLTRIARGGNVLAPGPAGLPLQYLDARDLAGWIVRCAETETVGVFNAVSEPGHTTMSELLATCQAVTRADATLVWVDPEFVLARGIEPWTQLPIWLPPGSDYDALHCGDTSRAAIAGLTCRPVAETVDDTWRWLSDGGTPRGTAGRVAAGLDPAIEAAALAAWSSESKS
jgi:2'-hydroxyisoflavone reductase